MPQRFYRNAAGAYLGSFDGATPPGGAVEVPMNPRDGRATWNGSQWVEPMVQVVRWRLKSTLYARMTDLELAAFDTMINASSVRTRRRWNDAVEVDPDMPEVLTGAIALFGPFRAAEILA